MFYKISRINKYLIKHKAKKIIFFINKKYNQQNNNSEFFYNFIKFKVSANYLLKLYKFSIYKILLNLIFKNLFTVLINFNNNKILYNNIPIKHIVAIKFNKTLYLGILYLLFFSFNYCQNKKLLYKFLFTLKLNISQKNRNNVI